MNDLLVAVDRQVVGVLGDLLFGDEERLGRAVGVFLWVSLGPALENVGQVVRFNRVAEFAAGRLPILP